MIASVYSPARIALTGSCHSVLTSCKVTQITAIRGLWQPSTSSLVHLMIPVGLGVLVDVVTCHSVS